MKTLLTLLILTYTIPSIAQYPRVDIPGSEVRNITSSIVSGQEYELHILFPSGYQNSTKKFPVLYLMDSQWDFPLVKSLIGQQYYDGFIPAMIVVGVTWGGTNPNPDSLRARDYTPTKDARLPQSGGASQFLSFLKKELFPFVERNYKASPDDRALMGCSLGGLFTLFTLFTEPSLFSGYVAASPAYQWDRGVIQQYEKAYFEKQPSSTAKLYMTIGDVERGAPGYEKLVAELMARSYKALQIKSSVLENTGHSGTKAETYSRGLQYVYERPSLTLDKSILNKYSGNYVFSNGQKVEIRNDGNRLAAVFGTNNQYQLHAASETDFYSTSEYFKIHFKSGPQKVEGFQLDLFGSSYFIKKTD